MAATHRNIGKTCTAVVTDDQCVLVLVRTLLSYYVYYLLGNPAAKTVCYLKVLVEIPGVAHILIRN